MKLNEIHIRDPFILAYEGDYYMFGTPMDDFCGGSRGFWCMKSPDMKEWTGPTPCFVPDADFWGERDFWAPEVHLYKDAFYMFATFMAEGCMRTVQILRSERPDGPYEVWSCPVTPAEHMCLDGTLYVEDGCPYMVYCHEWLQVGTGEICMIPLKEDLKGPAGEPVTLFSASEAGWAQPISSRLIDGKPTIVTDGPCLWKEEGKLYMIWSSFHQGKYAMGYCVSESGRVEGPWTQHDDLVMEKDGGHGMIFESFGGEKMLVLLQPNNAPLERPRLFPVKVEAGCVKAYIQEYEEMNG